DVGAIHTPASLPRASRSRADLYRRAVVFSGLPAGKGLPLPWVDLFVLARRVFDLPRAYLLSGSDLSHVVCGRRSSDRSVDRELRTELGQGCCTCSVGLWGNGRGAPSFAD